MKNQELLGLSVYALGQMYQAKEVSPTEVVKACLDRIEYFDPRVNAFCQVLAQQALDEARKAEAEIAAGNWWGPLHGIPFAVKDLFDVKGLPTRAGTIVFKDYNPDQDAFVVQRLRQAGGILLGKLNMQEFAFGISGRNPHYGHTLNPWNLGRMCGGSSSGSGAALAAGMVPIALGSDTGGSIRIPCSFCGVSGLKPTFGAVGRTGAMPLAWSLDHVGPMALYVEDLALTFGIMAGYDPNDSSSVKRNLPHYAFALEHREGLKGLVVGRPTNYFFEGMDPEVKKVVLTAVDNMAALGAEINEIKLEGVLAADRAALSVLFSEAAACLEVHARNRSHEVGEEALANVRLGMTIPATRYIQGLRIRTHLAKYLKKVFSQVDLLVVPATPVEAPPIEATSLILGGCKTDLRTILTRFTRYFNLAGVPVLTLPCGFSQREMPLGMQMVAGPFEELKLLRAGSAYQRAYPLKPLRPLLG
jgi:aspartyl-tRNA(Asn)/glutamyl-tRNA(Gln) amidotransferase subunit A